jgi:5-methylcytosine-specific restriction endonuclease McrA
MTNWHSVEVDEATIRRERRKAQELKASQWWKNIKHKGICHYCEKKFPPTDITMDHLVPLARGGTSTKGNVVPACRSCNQNKKLNTPVDEILQALKESSEPPKD